MGIAYHSPFAARTLSKTLGLALCVVGAWTMTGSAATLYGSTSAGGAGELYILNPATGAMLQDIGPLNDLASLNYPVTGLAVNPVTGVLYGSTGNAVAGTEARLITINPATAQVTVIGSFNAGPVNTSGTPATMTDLAFDSAGNLYGIGSIGGPQLYSINPLTGQATAIGSTGLASTSGGGLAISGANVFYGTPTPSRFGTYSPTGAYSNIAAPNLPIGGAYAAIDFDQNGTLYGLDLGPGPDLASHLVIINPATAGVTDLGASVTRLDAIVFVPEPGSASLLLVGVAGFLAARRRK